MAIALLVSLIVFPLFATIDFENRVRYCLKSLQQMQTIIIQGFICQNEMGAQISITRSSTIEQMVRTAMNCLCTRLVEARLEPSRFLQRIFNRKRRHLFDLTLQGKFPSSILCIESKKIIEFFSFHRTRRFYQFINVPCIFTSINGSTMSI